MHKPTYLKSRCSNVKGLRMLKGNARTCDLPWAQLLCGIVFEHGQHLDRTSPCKILQISIALGEVYSRFSLVNFGVKNRVKVHPYLWKCRGNLDSRIIFTFKL